MSNWHVARDLIDRFAANEPLDHVTEASIEQHIATCGRCQRRVAERHSNDLVDRVWSGVAARMDESESSIVERWLTGAGIEPAPARILTATPGLSAATVAAVVLVVGAVVWASRAADAAGLFLALAPVVPTVLVAASFATNVEPGGECTLATPEFGLALLLRRVLAVETLALLVLGVGSLFVSFDGARAMAWLLPATALSACTVAAGTRWPTPRSATVLLAAWFAALAVAESIGGDRGGPPFADTPVFGPAGQLTALAFLVGSIGVVYSQRHTVFQEVTR